MKNQDQKKLLLVSCRGLSSRHLESIRNKFGDAKIEQISPYKYQELEENNPQKLKEKLQEYEGIMAFGDLSHHIAQTCEKTVLVYWLNKRYPTQEKEVKKERIQQVEDSDKKEFQEYIKESMMDYVHHGLHRSDMDFDYLNEAAKAGVISHAGMAANALQETALEISDIQDQMMRYIKEGQHLTDFDYERLLEKSDSPEVLGAAFAAMLKDYDQWKDSPFAFEKAQDIYEKLELSRPRYERELFLQVRQNPIAENLLERVQEDIQKERGFID